MSIYPKASKHFSSYQCITSAYISFGTNLYQINIPNHHLQNELCLPILYVYAWACEKPIWHVYICILCAKEVLAFNLHDPSKDTRSWWWIINKIVWEDTISWIDTLKRIHIIDLYMSHTLNSMLFIDMIPKPTTFCRRVNSMWLLRHDSYVHPI